MNLKSLKAKIRRLEQATNLGSCADFLKKLSDAELEALVAALDAVLDIEDNDESAQVGIDIIAEHLDWPVAKAAGLWNGYKATCRRDLERLSNEELIAYIRANKDQFGDRHFLSEYI